LMTLPMLSGRDFNNSGAWISIMDVHHTSSSQTAVKRNGTAASRRAMDSEASDGKA